MNFSSSHQPIPALASRARCLSSSGQRFTIAVSTPEQAQLLLLVMHLLWQHFLTDGNVQNLALSYDGFGNIKTRLDAANGYQQASGGAETFAYDDLNQLKTATFFEGVQSISYDGFGRIIAKTGVNAVAGTYQYRTSTVNGSSTSNRLQSADNRNYSYDGNGNVDTITGTASSLNAGSITLSWTSFNQALTLPVAAAQNQSATNTNNANAVITLKYGTDNQRVLELLPIDATVTGANQTASRYVLHSGASLFYEEDVRADGSIEQRAYLTGPLGVVAVHTTNTDASGNPATPTGAQLNAHNNNGTPYTLTYWHRDHLGSLTVTTDDAGIVKERLRFDPWGKPMTALGSKARTGDRGFTGHEHLAGGLIHMNGRIYDPVLGRFLSADIVVQFPSAVTSYNRYAYVMNNPLAFTDPSGYFIVELFAIISTFLAANAGTIALTALAASGVAAATGHLTAARRFLGVALMFSGVYIGGVTGNVAFWTVAGAFASGGVQSGSLEGAVLAGITAGAAMALSPIIMEALTGLDSLLNSAFGTQAMASTIQTAGGGSFADSVRRMAEAQGMGLRAVADTAPAQLEKVVITASERAAAMNPYVQQDQLFDVGALYGGMALSRAITSSAARAAIRANQTTVRELKVPRNIHDGQQGKHIETHNNYDPNRGRSVLTSDPQTLLNEVHSGVHSVDVMSANKATVDFGKAIGKYYDNGVLVGETTRGTIHFGSQGAHIVPARPELLIPK